MLHPYRLRTPSGHHHHGVQPQQISSRGLLVQVRAKKKDDSKKGGGKADFSAYWSFQIQQLFRKRATVLQELNRENKRRDLEYDQMVARYKKEDADKMAVLIEQRTKELRARQKEQLEHKWATTGDDGSAARSDELNKAGAYMYVRPP